MYMFCFAKVIVKYDVPPVCMYDGEIVRRANAFDIFIWQHLISSIEEPKVALSWTRILARICFCASGIRRKRVILLWLFVGRDFFVFHSLLNGVCKSAAAFRCRYGGKSYAKHSRRFAEIRTWARRPVVYAYATIIHYDNNVHVSENLSKTFYGKTDATTSARNRRDARTLNRTRIKYTSVGTRPERCTGWPVRPTCVSIGERFAVRDINNSFKKCLPIFDGRYGNKLCIWNERSSDKSICP